MTPHPPRRPRKLLSVVWRQWRAERALAHRGINFRTADPDEAAVAYAAMTADEFDAINGRQAWANWRTVPAAVRGRLPVDRPWRVLDLGCGTGTSTSVLAAIAPRGSDIIGYELVPALAACAARRRYADGVRVRFVCQGVGGTLNDPDGAPLPDGVADLAHASGVIGHHFDAVSVRPLAAELARVVFPGGLAVLDYGPTLPRAALVDVFTGFGFAALGHYKAVPFARSGQVTFRRG